MAVVAAGVDDPAWVDGRGYLTDGLVLFGLLGVLVGFIGPKVGWGRWTTHIIGAVFAGLLIPILAGLAFLPGAVPGAAFHFAAAGSPSFIAPSPSASAGRDAGNSPCRATPRESRCGDCR